MHSHSTLTRSPIIPFTGLARREKTAAPAAMSVRFEDVRFGYADAGHKALTDVSFEIAAGQMVALAGHAGAGKRSCARLLLRLCEAEAGHVRIDGKDIRDLPAETLEDYVTLVPRDCALAPERIVDHFTRARPGATRHEIETVARLAQVHDVITPLPQGYETSHDLWRTGLTAGQRQRLALACAVLGGAPILILDEIAAPLSAADDAAWQAALSHIRRGRTVLLIAHRLSTLRMADAIVVMEQGAVVEEGRHDELVAWNDRYARLVANRTLA